MPTYLYGLILSPNAGRVPTNVAGVEGAAVRAVPCGPLAALVSTVAAAPSRQDRNAIVAHDVAQTKIVRHAVTVVSSRFGQTFDDDTALCRQLAMAPNHARLVATLERYDGCGEMRIVMRDRIDSPATMHATLDAQDSPGRAYLESLREKLKSRPPVDFRVLAGEWIRDERVERRGNVQTISHLVRLADEAKYRAELYAHPALEGAAITGPHALYTFAEPDA